MEQSQPDRRTVLQGGAALAGLSVLQVAGPASAFADDSGAADGVVVPWLDQPAPVPPPAQDAVGHLLRWESLDSWRTPVGDFFTVKHYGQPSVSTTGWRLGVDGLVDHPMSLRLEDLEAARRSEVDVTLECSGNHGLPFVIGAIGNATWAGASLRTLLRQAGPQGNGHEVVFWGADSGPVTVRDDSGITGAGTTGTATPDSTGGLDLTITEQFARSMSLEEAMDPANLLCYAMNDVPLPAEHGAPLRLIAPGWYGVANVKWLTRIEVRQGRYAGRFMARDYVTIREQQHAGRTVWTFTTVGRARLKSAPAKVVRRAGAYAVRGAAWGARIAAVEVQVDGGAWRSARLDPQRGTDTGHAWRLWTFDWGHPSAGVHTIRTRAHAVDGSVQPAPDEPVVTNRRTYWENPGQITRRVRVER